VIRLYSLNYFGAWINSLGNYSQQWRTGRIMGRMRRPFIRETMCFFSEPFYD